MSLDKTFAKIIRPVDARSNAGTMARGKNVYRGGAPNATRGPIKNKKGAITREQVIRYMQRKRNGY